MRLAVLQVEVVRATSELILRGLQPGTMYKVRVRVKLDGISYSGYWSTWSQPVSIETLPAGWCSLKLTRDAKICMYTIYVKDNFVKCVFALM